MTTDPQPRDGTPDDPPGGDAADMVIVDSPEARRYEARIGEQLVGWVDYGRVQDRLVALHTEVPPEFGGQGIASALVRRVLDDARAAGLKVTPRCPLFATHFKRHPEDADLLAERPVPEQADDST
jgi:uncharacterized protein